MKQNQENLDLLRMISKKPQVSQRILADELGFSLGKLNYLINALKKKGLIKIKNFKNNKNKINYIYILTPKGITKKSFLTIVDLFFVFLFPFSFFLFLISFLLLV